MDMLLSTGEQISVALCAMAIEVLGYPVVSLTGWQAGILTDTAAKNARIKKIDTERLEAELDQKRIVIVTGFQGVDRNTKTSLHWEEAVLILLQLHWQQHWKQTCARSTQM